MAKVNTVLVSKDGDVVTINETDLKAWKARGYKATTAGKKVAAAPAPTGEPGINVPPSIPAEIVNLTKPDLVELAQAYNIDGAGTMLKTALIAALDAKR